MTVTVTAPGREGWRAGCPGRGGRGVAGLPRLLLALVLLGAPAVLALDAGPAAGQDWRRQSREIPADLGHVDYDGRLTFARVRFEPRSAWEGWAYGMPAWGHDYPRAERNFMRILQEITLARAFTGGSRIVTLDDPDLFKFPIAYLCEPGHWTMTDREAQALREYLLKGGFVIFDDFTGYHWRNFAEQMERVLPGVQFLPMDVEHPLFHAFFEVESLNILDAYRGRTPQFFGVYEDNDPEGRLLAIVNYNTDIGDYFEYSDTGWLPVDLSNEAFKLGVNYWMYALTR